MYRLATKRDVEHFVFESSPHVKKVRVNEDEDSNVIINIELDFWYSLFYSKKYQRFLMDKMEPQLLAGVDYYVNIE
jgi:hypothetical protein